MIVAHLSDLHLGYRAYDRTDRGRNVREKDVAAAFDKAVVEMVSIRPGLVLVTGDVFDRPDPPPGALVTITRGLEILRSELPDTPVLMIPGARDTPRRPGDPVALAALDTFPQVEAATGTARTVPVLDGTVQVSMVPYRACLKEPFPVLEPDPRARYNLVMAYARASRAGRWGPVVDPAAWDYVALGSEHAHRSVAENVVYAGSLERVGPRPWREAAVEKGFVVVNLESRRSTFHSISVRPVVALAPIRVPADDPEGLRARVREVTDEVPGGIDGKIVHLTLEGLDGRDILGLQGDLLESLRRRALHLTVEVSPAGGETTLETFDVRSLVRERLGSAGIDPGRHEERLEELFSDRSRRDVGEPS